MEWGKKGQRSGAGDADLGGVGRRGDVAGEEKANWGDSGWVAFAFGRGEDWEEDGGVRCWVSLGFAPVGRAADVADE